MKLLRNPPFILPILALLTATLLWGSSFITISQALRYTNPFTLVACRFACACLFLAILLKGQIHKIPRATWKGGVICGTAIFLCYLANTAGLMTIQSSLSGFLTALYVPFTPLLLWIVFKKRPEWMTLFGVSIAFMGLVLLSNPFQYTFRGNWGELITIFSAFMSAFEIILVGRFAKGTQARQFAFCQLLTVSIFATITLGIISGLSLPVKTTIWNRTVIFAILWLATIVGCVQILLSWAQRFVSPNRAAIIFAMESVFAAIIGWFAGENLGPLGLFGGACIVLGIILSECKLPTRKKKVDSSC